jgi:hypothetical protein
MFARASTVLKAVAVGLSFSCWYLEMPSNNRIQKIPSCVHYHAQSFRLDALHDFYAGTGNSNPELYLVRQYWSEYCLIYMRSLLFVESFDLRPCSKYVLGTVIPSYFRSTKILQVQMSALLLHIVMKAL